MAINHKFVSVAFMAGFLVLAMALSAPADSKRTTRFQPGDVASASAMNENFEVIEEDMEAQAARITDLEAVSGTKRLTFPISALTFYDTVDRSPGDGGVYLTAGVGAGLRIRCPRDYGNTEVQLTITAFVYAADGPGVVDFGLLANSRDVGVQGPEDSTYVVAPGVAVDGLGNSIQTQVFSVPAENLVGEVWRFFLFRADGDYTGGVVVTSVDLEYGAR